MALAEFNSYISLLNGQAKQRLQGLEKVQVFLQRVSLDRDHLSELVECLSRLLTDNNFKVAQYSLRALDALVLTQRESVKPFVNQFFDALVERLGDMKQPVRMDAFPVLLSLMEVLKPDSVVERVGKFWNHKNWRIRHGLLQTFAEAVSKFGTDVLLSKSSDTNLIKQALRLTEDPDSTVRDAAVEFLEEAYRVTGNALIDIIKRSNLRPAVTKEILARLVPESEQQLAAEAGPGEPDIPQRTAEISKTLSGLQLNANGHQDHPRHMAEQHTSKAADVAPMPTPAVASQDAPAITVNSEKELKNELDKILVNLASSVKWDERNKAMMRLEALVNGGATAYDAFPHLMKNLQDALAQQIIDRRSAIVRQVCRLLSIMAAAMELEFEMLAAQFLPLLFKVLVITIQVMADAADACIHHIIHYCHSPRLLGLFLHAATKDKNAKIRQCCSVYLVQLLEEWHPSIIAKHMDAVEEAICVAAQGTLPQTRVFGRCAYAAYANQQPERANEVLRKVASSLQGKLVEAANSYRPGSAAGLKKLQFFLPPPGIVRSPSKLRQSSSSNGTPYEADVKPAINTPRKSTALQPDLPLSRMPRTSSHDGTLESVSNTPHALSRASNTADLYAGWSLTRLGGVLAGEPKPWADKVALLNAISDGLQASTATESYDVQREVERMLPKLLESLDDGHYKVVCACLTAVRTMIAANASVAEASCDKLLPGLFQRLVDNREPVRELAQDAIHACGNRFSADTLLCGLTRTIEATKLPKVRVAALEFTTMFLGHDTTAGVPTNSIHLRQWLTQIVPLLSDKASEVRKAGSVALSCTYRNMDNTSVLLHYAHAPKADAVAMKKALADHVSNMDVELHNYLHSRGNSSISKPYTPTVASAEDRAVLSKPALELSEDDVCIASPEVPADEAAPVSRTPPPYTASRSRGSLSDTSSSVFTALDAVPVSNSHTSSSLGSPAGQYEDLAYQSQSLALLLARCQASVSVDALNALADLAHTFPAAAWEPNVSQALLVLLHCIQHEEAGVREAALVALRQVVSQHGEQVSSLLSSILPAALLCCGDGVKEVSFAGHGAVDAMLCVLPGSSCMSLLLQKLPSPASPVNGTASESEVLSAILRGVQQCAGRMATEELKKVTAGSLFPWLLWAFEDSRPDVRKAVTFCLVQLWLLLGDWMLPYLDKLAAPQLNLVTIYYDRAKAQQAVGNGATF